MYKLIASIVLLAISLSIYALPGYQSTYTEIVWDAPLTDVRGDMLIADTALSHFTVYCGLTSGDYSNPITTIAEFIWIDDVISVDGLHYCIVTASNVDGESVASNEILVTRVNGVVAKGNRPNPPGLLRLR